MRVTMRHLRAVGFCSRGARIVAKRGGIDWSKFLAEGIDIEELRVKIDPAFCDKLEEQHVKKG